MHLMDPLVRVISPCFNDLTSIYQLCNETISIKFPSQVRQKLDTYDRSSMNGRSKQREIHRVNVQRADVRVKLLQLCLAVQCKGCCRACVPCLPVNTYIYITAPLFPLRPLKQHSAAVFSKLIVLQFFHSSNGFSCRRVHIEINFCRNIQGVGSTG